MGLPISGLVYVHTHIVCIQCTHVQSLSHVRLFAALWTAAHQAHLSMGLSWEAYRSGLPFPLPGDLPDPGIEPGSPASPALQVNSLLLNHLGSP